MIAVWAAKAAGFGCRITGKQGVTLAGQIALKIDPDILKELSAQVKEKIFVTCGTNGKTTTNNLLCSALEEEGRTVVCNHTGSNMLNGVAAAFAQAASLGGNLKADYACIEVDEASALRIFPHFKPDFMILTNLFRDQLDRYGEIDITMNFLKKAMDMAPGMKIIVNGDDSLSTYLAMESSNSYVTFGIGDQYFKDQKDSSEIREGTFCKKCGSKMEYRFYHYSQLGDYFCSECGFQRPKLDYNAVNVKAGGNISFEVNGISIEANYRGFYNIYNILAAYAAGCEAGEKMISYNRVLRKYSPENGRNEAFSIDGTDIILNLAKNPAGFNQNISAVMEDERPKDLIILINDNSQDGIDVSWLWDVDFERFKEANIKSITVSGIRCQDMRIRLKYADIPSILEPDIEKAITDRIQDGVKNLYVLVNYTGLYKTHNILKKLEGDQK